MNKIKNYLLFIVSFIIILIGMYGAYHLNVTEELSTTLPGLDSENEGVLLLERSKEILTFTMDLPGGLDDVDISEQSDSVVIFLENELGDLVTELSYSSDLDPESMAQWIYDHLPLYLEEKDYPVLDSLIQPSVVSRTMKGNYSMLRSTTGMGMAGWIIRDPLHLLSQGIENIYPGQGTDQLSNSSGLFLSEERDKIFIRGKLTQGVSNSKQNELLAKRLKTTRDRWNQKNQEYELDYFGLFLIADSNARQIKKDVRVTIGFALLVILSLIIYYYRNLNIILVFIGSSAFGILFALGIIYFRSGSMSGLALGASAAILGIIIDYSFHFMSHYRTSGDAIETRNSIARPLIIGGLTTITAFSCLLFASSQALRDFGLFASLSLAGTLMFVLLIAPLIFDYFSKKQPVNSKNKIDRMLDCIQIDQIRPGILGVLTLILVTGILFYYAGQVEFENDLGKLNYYPEDLKQREREIQNIDPDQEERINFISSGMSLDSATGSDYKLQNVLFTLKKEGRIKEINSMGKMLIPEKFQTERISRWNSFWDGRREVFLDKFQQISDSIGFNSSKFSEFYELISQEPDTTSYQTLINSAGVFKEAIIDSEGKVSIVSSIVVEKNESTSLKKELKNLRGVTMIDGQSAINTLIELVRKDFKLLLILASSIVFITMLLAYGNLELTLISFLPVAISWIWILGLASLLNIKFNFINSIITTFIFGLGDDFSIFITDGMLKKYRSGEKVLPQYKTAILLSAVSTMVGTGVLIFAGHPALRSIAMLSVLGIVCIVCASFLLQPLIFNGLIASRTGRGKPPYTLPGIVFSFFTFSIFALGSLCIVFFSALIRILPFLKPEAKKGMIHKIIQWFCGFEMSMAVTSKDRHVQFENLDFDKPSLLIANHSSFLDILFLLKLDHRIVMMTNKWVQRSVLFGPVVRYLDFPPSYVSLEENREKINELNGKGYSVVIFPEGSRSADGKMSRFHKGAFYLAEELDLDISPVMILGPSYCLPKGEYYFNYGKIDLVALPRISSNDSSFGETYQEKTKSIGRYFKNSYREYLFQKENVDFAYAPLINMFRYKGPLEYWYFRIKWKYEKTNYEHYSQLIGPGSKTIYDMGCGYGYISYFLYLRDDRRKIMGFDFDEKKIKMAGNAYLKNNQVLFEFADICNVKPEGADAVIFGDVLHYLQTEEQIRVLDQSVAGLNPGGVILIRDGITDLEKGHEWTMKSEKWSTSILKFNKTKGPLEFFNKDFIQTWARSNSLSFDLQVRSETSSNVLFILRKDQ